jgi:high-affinity iron transporter
MEYNWLDSFSIVLREGMEALLVLIALLAFLDKSGNGDKRSWIWGGAIAGLAA